LGVRVVVVGQGYVGLPLAMRCVEAGHFVVGFDTDEQKISNLKLGISPIDDVTSSKINEAISSDRYIPTSNERDLQSFNVAVITVPTPLLDSAPDTSFIESAAKLLAKNLDRNSLVILESTSYPGTTEDLLAPILEAGSGLTRGKDFSLAFSPERIDPGNTLWTLKSTPKLVSGVDEQSVLRAKDFYEPLIDQLIVASGVRETEFAKLLENTFRQVNIALINELAIHANSLGIDIWEVIRLAATKPFGYTPFYPGPGVGGHCLPIDPEYLSWKFLEDTGEGSKFVKLATSINKKMPEYVVKRLKSGLNSRGIDLKGASVFVVGVSYKKNSSDIRESPAIETISLLVESGAKTVAFDSRAKIERILKFNVSRELDLAVAKSADVTLILTNHDEVDYDAIVDNSSYVFDVRHCVLGANVEYL
jgi:UDP-N-acetyl-D-glucosamine dehydrogenase